MRLTPEAARELRLILNRRSLDLVDGLTIEAAQPEAGRRTVFQTDGRDLELDLVVGFSNGFGTHDHHTSLLALAWNEQGLRQSLALRSHDRR